MFIAALFTIAKCWKQLKCPSVNEWIKKLWYIYTMEFYAAEIVWYLSFTAWLISLSIMLPRSIHALVRVGSPSFFLEHGIPLCKCTIVF